MNSRIVKVAAGGVAGSVLTITGLSTPLDTPRGVAVDGLGNIYVADTNNNRIVTVSDGGVGSPLSIGAVTLSAPKGIAVAAFGTLCVADTSDNRGVAVRQMRSGLVICMGNKLGREIRARSSDSIFEREKA